MDKEMIIAVKGADLQSLVLCSVGYSLGRQSYVVHEVCSLVRQYHAVLDAQTIRTILRYIDTAPSLGMDCDVSQWMALKAFLEGRE